MPKQWKSFLEACAMCYYFHVKVLDHLKLTKFVKRGCLWKQKGTQNINHMWLKEPKFGRFPGGQALSPSNYYYELNKNWLKATVYVDMLTLY